MPGELPKADTIGHAMRAVADLVAEVRDFAASLSVEGVQEFVVDNVVRTRDYLGSVPMDEEAVMACQIGLAVGLCVMTFLVMFPGEPFDYTKLDGGKGEGGEHEVITPKTTKPGAIVTEEETELAEKDKIAAKADSEAVSELTAQITKASKQPKSKDPKSTKEELSMEWDDAKIIKKFSRVQKVFALSDEQMKLAIDNARREAAGQKVSMNDVNNTADGDGFSLSQKVDVVVYVSLILAFIYFARRDFGGEAGRYIRIYFPREARLLGIGGGIGEEVWKANGI